MSLADEFLRDAGVAQGPATPLSAQFAQDVSGAPAEGPRRPLQPPEPLSVMDKLLAKVPTGLVNNPAVAGARNVATMAAAPIVGGAQLIANAMPETTGVPQLYNRKAAEMLRANADAAKENPATAGVNEFVGGMISPANLAMGGNAVPAVTTGARALQGAKIGAVGGATAPVEVGESGKYWGQKGVQTAVGTGGGAVLAPLMGAIGDRVVARINRSNFNPANAAKEADDIIAGAVKDANQRLEDIPADQLAGLRKQVTDSLSKGKRLDAAAALRAQDFAAEKITPTLGQVTRDPMQFAAEQNVRGVKGAGEPLTQRLEEGNRAVSTGIGQYGTNASEAPAAASVVAGALRSYDTGKRAAVTDAYKAARESVGKDLDIPLQGLAQDYADISHRYAEKIPGGVRNAFEDFGLGKGKQTKVFTPEEADKLLKTINDNWSPDSKAALGELNRAVKAAVTSVDATGGPFAPAVKLARERFAEQDAIPALRAAAAGKVDDAFVQKYVIGSPKSEEVQKLAALLRKEAPDAYQETRQQIGAYLSRAAFGENAAGDKIVKQESYNKALRQLGTAKLEAFFEPQEVEQLKRLARIASYQVSPPAGSASNYSNTASALANLLRSAGGFIPVAKGTVQFAGDKIEARAALNGKVPVTPNLTEDQRKALSRALVAITGGASIALPSGVVGQ